MITAEKINVMELNHNFLTFRCQVILAVRRLWNKTEFHEKSLQEKILKDLFFYQNRESFIDTLFFIPGTEIVKSLGGGRNLVLAIKNEKFFPSGLKFRIPEEELEIILERDPEEIAKDILAKYN